MQPDSIVTTVMGEKIRVSDVIAYLKLKGQFREAIYEIIEQKVIALAAAEFGVDVSEDELRRKAHERKVSLGIDDPERFTVYLRFHGSTEDRWLKHIHNEALREALKQAVVPPERVDAVFESEPQRFAAVSVSRVVCRTRRDADQALVDARRTEFVAAARKHSIDESTRMSGGFLGLIKMNMLPPEVAKAVLGCVPNDIVGPFRENGLWTVYKIHAVNTPKLTEALSKSIRDQLFIEWLRKRVCTVPA